MKKLVIRSTIWAILGFGSSQIIRFAGNLILTRLLLPEFFGLLALVYIFISGLEILSDFGLGYSIVQHEKGDDQDFLDIV